MSAAAAHDKAQLIGDAVRAFDDASFVRLRQPMPPGVGFSGGFGSYELARIRVPKGSVGVVTLIWQAVYTNTGLLAGPVLDLGPDVTCTWSLVQEDDGAKGPLRSHVDTMDPKVPESRIPPYGAWTDLRHPWGTHERVKVLVPERSTVSLWARVWAPGAEIRQVGGRLFGYTQSGSSPHAVANLVMSY